MKLKDFAIIVTMLLILLFMYVERKEKAAQLEFDTVVTEALMDHDSTLTQIYVDMHSILDVLDNMVDIDNVTREEVDNLSMIVDELYKQVKKNETMSKEAMEDIFRLHQWHYDTEQILINNKN